MPESLAMRMANGREVAGYALVRIDILISDASDRTIAPTAEESKGIDEQMASNPDNESWDRHETASHLSAPSLQISGGSLQKS